MNGNLEGNFTHDQISDWPMDKLNEMLYLARSYRDFFLAGVVVFEWPDGRGSYQLSPEHEETEIAYLERDIWNLVQALARP